MISHIKLDVHTEKRSYSKKNNNKHEVKNKTSNLVTNKYMKNHLSNNLIPGMVSFDSDTDYMKGIINY